MAENNSPAELGFAEFVAKLISEMFNALATAQFDQEKQLAELAEASSISLSEFGKRFITDEQVDLELEQLFPGIPPENPTSIYLGAPYKPRQNNSDESPPIQAVLGVVLGKGDYGRKGTLLILKQPGVNKLTAAVRGKLANSQQSDIVQVLNRGIPRIIADAGKINAKLTYEVLSTEQAVKPERAKSLAAPVNSLVSTGYLSKSPTLSKFHLLVRQADERAPQTSTLKVNVFGEVEITFKTIM
jgi:hypothetical protein